MKCLRKHCCVGFNAALLGLLWIGLLSLVNGIVLALLIPSAYESSNNIFVNFNNATFLLLPIIGLIMDMWIGRYKLVVSCVYLSYIGMIAAIVTLMLKLFHYEFIALNWLTAVIFTLSFGTIRANVVPFYIEQMIEGSGQELSSAIYWHFTALIFPLALQTLSFCFLSNRNVINVIGLVCISCCLVTSILCHIIFRKTIINAYKLGNPIKLILQVLNYARKNKYPRNRSALTYWEDNYPSRLDLGKEKYGGPFSEEEVEDVKTVFRLIPLLVVILAFTFSCREPLWIRKVYYNLEDQLLHNSNDAIPACIFKAPLLTYLLILIFIFIHLFIIYPFCYRYLPSMLKRIGFGVCFSIIGSVIYMSVAARTQQLNDFNGCLLNFANTTSLSTTHYTWLIPSQLLCGIGYFLVVVTSLEFTVAQSPCHMRGLMVGVWYGIYGVGELISYNIHNVFRYIKEPKLGCGFYYFLTKGFIATLLLITFLVLAKRYKLRVRENEVNVYLLIDKHYDKYLGQKALHENNYNSF